MKFILSNDDGIDAEGLQALSDAARGLGEASIVAPDGPRSGASHAVTLEHPVRLERRSERRFAVHGTPADCARLGLLLLAPEADWVLSGVNRGGNLGADVYYSGTVAAVREAVLHGKPGIAFSHYLRHGLAIDWPRAARWAARVLADLLPRPVEPGLFYNVNFPHLTPESPEPETVFCSLDPHPLPLSYRPDENGDYYYNGVYLDRPRKPGFDVDVCFRGDIAITELRLF